MPIKIKSAQAIAEKWQRVTPGRTQEYEMGVSDTSVDWEGPAQASRDNWEAGIQQAIAQDRFSKGIRRAGNEAWREGAQKKGVQRFAQGVRASGPKYEEGFAPYRQVIADTNLPPRGPAGDPANLERVRVVNERLHEKKNQLKGS